MLRERAGEKKNNTGRSRGGAEPSTVFDHYPNWFFLFSTRFGGKKKKYFVDIVPEMIPDLPETKPSSVLIQKTRLRVRISDNKFSADDRIRSQVNQTTGSPFNVKTKGQQPWWSLQKSNKQLLMARHSTGPEWDSKP